MKKEHISHMHILFLFLLLSAGCQKGKPDPGTPDPGDPPAVRSDITAYITRGDRAALFSKQQEALNFTAGAGSGWKIEVDTTQIYQGIDGFGYTLTGGSTMLLNQLSASDQDAILRELFLWDSTFIGVSYLRISIGASDLDAVPFTYNDLPAGQTDTELTNFSINKDKTHLIPVLKKILALNPSIKILGTPWTAPIWMKTNDSYIGGSLAPAYYSVYAKYLVKYIQAMKEEGITIDAITPQNEPLHGGNNPSMVMQAAEQADFIKNHLGPAFRDAGITTKIILYDHNADRPDYPISILDDADAKPFIDGSAFHLYGGNISALSQVHDAHPDKSIYFTEQWVGGPSNFGEDLKWHIENLIIGATRNWSRNVLEWNLAADQNYDPHTEGGCTNCLGALTINGSSVTRNVAYYIIAHASKFVRPGSVRIASNHIGTLMTVAFKNPEGKKVLIVLNKDTATQSFNIVFDGKSAAARLDGGAVGTYVW